MKSIPKLSLGPSLLSANNNLNNIRVTSFINSYDKDDLNNLESKNSANKSFQLMDLISKHDPNILKVQALLEAKADPNGVLYQNKSNLKSEFLYDNKYNSTPLQMAIKSKNNNLLSILSLYGANLNGMDVNFMSPICCAILYNNFEAFKFLLDKGVSTKKYKLKEDFIYLVNIKNFYKAYDIFKKIDPVNNDNVFCKLLELNLTQLKDCKNQKYSEFLYLSILEQLEYIKNPSLPINDPIAGIINQIDYILYDDGVLDNKKYKELDKNIKEYKQNLLNISKFIKVSKLSTSQDQVLLNRYLIKGKEIFQLSKDLQEYIKAIKEGDKEYSKLLINNISQKFDLRNEEFQSCLKLFKDTIKYKISNFDNENKKHIVQRNIDHKIAFLHPTYGVNFALKYEKDYLLNLSTKMLYKQLNASYKDVITKTNRYIEALEINRRSLRKYLNNAFELEGYTEFNQEIIEDCFEQADFSSLHRILISYQGYYQQNTEEFIEYIGIAKNIISKIKDLSYKIAQNIIILHDVPFNKESDKKYQIFNIKNLTIESINDIEDNANVSTDSYSEDGNSFYIREATNNRKCQLLEISSYEVRRQDYTSQYNINQFLRNNKERIH